jgi:short-subunit dehydrogenase
MSHQLAFIISGTAPNSLGEDLVRSLRNKWPDSPVLAIDKEHNPSLKDLQGVYEVVVDLNPFTSTRGYRGLIHDLNSGIQHGLQKSNARGIGTAILAAGTYESGSLLETSTEGRQRLIGVNVCGKIEVLHAALATNQRLGCPSSEAFTLVDVGTLHALMASPNRSLYVATKALGLDLCMSMQRGGEVSRAIHLAPGPIDTHMLHRNHWVSKEHGSVEFFDRVRGQNTRLYQDVFIQCEDDAFAEAVSTSQTDSDKLATVFDRYKTRRREQFSSEHGVLSVSTFADYLITIIADRIVYTDGVYILTAPGGQTHMQHLAFSDVIRYGDDA